MVDNPNNNDGRYTVDIRVFIGMIVMAMAISFGVGVGMGPTAMQLLQKQQQLQSSSKLPEVTSVNFATPLEVPQSDDLHEPAGQHLLVDIKGIEADFLDSEARLSHAMVETVKQSGLTMLSYHCHKLIPKGVSCVGVLLESHISFHTWPDEGVITLDLFTCGNKPLIPAVGTIKELFGIPRAGDEIRMQWSHELRGFRNKNRSRQDGSLTANSNYAVLDHNSDLSEMIWSPIDCVVKDQIVSTLTKYQRVDIWDLVGLEETPSYADALKHNLQPGDPRWTTAEIVSPTRYLFLDGVLQSESTSHVEYHEAMVHPGMFSHPHPTRVAIIGGGEGATLREVLKHKTVEHVTMVEIDQELIDIVKEHMPYFSDCSDLVGRSPDCFADPSTNLVIQDASAWLTQEQPTQKFDVVILDAMEPEMGSPISKSLYQAYADGGSLELIMNSLTDEGILAIQIGRAPTILDPRPDIGFNAPREALFQALEGLDQVAAMFVYEDPHCGFTEPRAFMVVCKSSSCRKRFYASADEMDYFIYDRIVKTHSKTRALKYFDGVTHLGYQVAPKAWETIYCRREPTPFECAYRHLDFKAPLMEFNLQDEAAGAFSVTAEYVIGEDGNPTQDVSATHVWANVDVPKGAYIMPEHLASSLQLTHQSIANLKRNLEYGGVTVIEDFVDFVEEHGHESQAMGSARTLVEIGASYFIQVVESEEEANVGRWIPPHPEGKRPKYSPVYERHRLSFDVFMVATKDIPRGTELKRYSKMWQAA